MALVPDGNLQQCYRAVASLECRKAELTRLIEQMSAHMLGYPVLYTRGEAAKWVEEAKRLILKAERLEREEHTR